jgi:predicted nucleic acid-binding protein
MARAYLDSCVVIYLIQGPEDLSQRVRGALQPAEAAVPATCVSELTRLECRVWPIREADEPLLGKFDEFFASQDVERIALETEVFDLATELRAHHGTKTPDALHLAAAILGGCQEFWTNDHRLSAAAAGKVELKIFA